MANLFEIPNYIKAASPIGLRRLMLETQRRDSMQYNFFDIQFANGFWFAWYVKKANTDVEKNDVVNELMGEPENGG